MELTVEQLAQWLAGEFSNRAQAIAQPAWFVDLYLWHRPLPMEIEGQRAFFAEQAPALKRDRPYRQRVFALQAQPEAIAVQYYAFREPERFLGAGAAPEKLRSLCASRDLDMLPGCVLDVAIGAGTFAAKPRANHTCRFQVRGHWYQVELGFEVSQSEFYSYDRGIDPETGRGIWGALISPYRFEKCQNGL